MGTKIEIKRQGTFEASSNNQSAETSYVEMLLNYGKEVMLMTLKLNPLILYS
jgi:hypothetical protein